MKKIIIAFLFVFLLGWIIPENFKMPVVGATKNSYNQESSWYYPWGKSVTHKGVDVFVKKELPLLLLL